MALQVQASELQGGRDYPRSEGEVRAWFPGDDACRDYLEWLRWPTGSNAYTAGRLGPPTASPI